MKCRALALSAGLLMLGLMPGATLAVAPSSLDQDNEGITTTVDSSDSLAQTFTVGKAGLLSEVDLYSRSDHAGGSAETISIKALDGSGHPTGSALAMASVNPASHDAADWVPFSLSTPLSVTVGKKLAIVFNVFGDKTVWGSTNTYAGGQALMHQGSWIPLSGSAPADFAFRTYVSDNVTVKLAWGKTQILAGSTSTTLTLKETITYDDPSRQASQYAADLDGWPLWFAPTGITCSPAITNCTIADFEGKGVIAPPNSEAEETLIVTVVGTATPVTADLGTAGANAYGCLVYPLGAQARPNQDVPGCAEGLASIQVVSVLTSPPPTSTGAGVPVQGSGSGVWFLSGALLALFGSLLALATRWRRRISKTA